MDSENVGPRRLRFQLARVSIVQFDQSAADAIIQKLGSEIARGSKFQARPWTDLVVVVNLSRGRQNVFGYVFWEPNEWEGATPDGFDALDLAIDLQKAMRVPGQEPWQRCRVRITRATGQIDIDFDYEGDKWVSNMADPAGFAFSLRH